MGTTLVVAAHPALTNDKTQTIHPRNDASGECKTQPRLATWLGQNPEKLGHKHHCMQPSAHVCNMCTCKHTGSMRTPHATTHAHTVGKPRIQITTRTRYGATRYPCTAREQRFVGLESRNRTWHSICKRTANPAARAKAQSAWLRIMGATPRSSRMATILFNVRKQASGLS